MPRNASSGVADQAGGGQHVGAAFHLVAVGDERPARAGTGTCSCSSARTSRGSGPTGRAPAWPRRTSEYDAGKRRTSTHEQHDEDRGPHDVQPGTEPVAAEEVADRVDRPGERILEAAAQRGPVLQRDRLPEVAELGADPGEVRPPRPATGATTAPTRSTRDRASTPSASRARLRSRRGPRAARRPVGTARRGSPPPTAHPNRRDAEPEEHDDAEHHRGRLRVPHHQHRGGGEQRREPRGAARASPASPVSRSASRCSSAPNASADPLATTSSAAAV